MPSATRAETTTSSRGPATGAAAKPATAEDLRLRAPSTFATVAHPERCPSGRRGTPGERVYPQGTEGSNPSLSARFAHVAFRLLPTAAAVQLTSAARRAHGGSRSD